MCLAWEPILKHLASDILKFDTDKAKKFSLGVGDHHVGWQTLVTFLFGTADAIVIKYIGAAQTKKIFHQSPINNNLVNQYTLVDCSERFKNDIYNNI